MKSFKKITALFLVTLFVFGFNLVSSAATTNNTNEAHYELYFDNGWEFWDWIDGYCHYESTPGFYLINLFRAMPSDIHTFSVFASGTDENGNPINVESIKYVINDKYENETGAFEAYQVYDCDWYWSGGATIKAIATFADGTVKDVEAPVYIQTVPPRTA